LGQGDQSTVNRDDGVIDPQSPGLDSRHGM
jgi:hypothetical protein